MLFTVVVVFTISRWSVDFNMTSVDCTYDLRYAILLFKFIDTTNNLRSEFHLSTDQLKQVFILPHIVAFEPYVKAFQYKILNSILFTNVKLHKIDFKESDLCLLVFVRQYLRHYIIYYFYAVIQGCFGPISRVIGSL